MAIELDVHELEVIRALLDKEYIEEMLKDNVNDLKAVYLCTLSDKITDIIKVIDYQE